MNNTRHLRPESLAGKRWRGWVRESTQKQAEKWSPEAQREGITRAAAELGMVGDGRWYERTGSGEAEATVEMAQALADGRAHQYDVLVVYATSRFARNRAEAVTMKREFARAGIVVYFVAERLISGTYAGALSEGLHEVIDEHANEERRLWIAGGHKQRQLSGRWIGNIPYGYRRALVDFEDGTRGWDGDLEPDPETAPHVRHMFDRVATGASLRAIAFELNGDGVRSPRGSLWQHRTVHDIVQNPVYTGRMIRYRDRAEATYYEREGPDGHMDLGERFPAIIEPALWAQVQELVGQRRYSGRHEWRSYPLSRVLRCGACGYRMTGVSSRNVRYYRCVGRTWYGICTASAVRAEVVEAAFAAWLGSYRLPDDWREAIARSSVREARTNERDRQATLEQRLARIKKQHEYGLIEDDDLRSKVADIKGQMAVMAKPSIPALESVAAALADLGSAWAYTEDAEAKAALPPLMLKAAEMRPGGVDWIVRAELRPLLELCGVPSAPSLTVGELEYDVRYSA